MVQNKKAKNKGKAKKMALNLSEKMCLLKIAVGFMHCIILLDIDSYSGFMHIELCRPILLGVIVGGMYQSQVMLVTSWNGLIESAMKKSKPAWSENFGRIKLPLVSKQY